MEELGFLTIAFDPSYTGESGGAPRYVASPDINTEDFCAAVDFLSVQENVDPEHIGIIGICGWGGMAINAAAIDTRIKATLTVLCCPYSTCVLGLLNPGGPIAQFTRNRCSISPVELISLSGVRKKRNARTAKSQWTSLHSG